MQDSCSQLQPRKRKQPEEGVATEAQQPRITAVTYSNETGQITMKKKKEPSDTAQEQFLQEKGTQPWFAAQILVRPTTRDVKGARSKPS